MKEIQEIRVRFLGQEDPLEEEMISHFSILAWKIPRTEEPGRLQSMQFEESGTTEQLSTQQVTLKLSTLKIRNA